MEIYLLNLISLKKEDQFGFYISHWSWLDSDRFVNFSFKRPRAESIILKKWTTIFKYIAYNYVENS